MTSLVELSVEDSVAIVRLNRPDVRNAINDEMRAQFVAALDRAANDEVVRAVVLTGSGKSFCSGGDISGMRERLQAPSGKVAFNGWRRQQQTHKSVAALHGMGKVTVAAVNGVFADTVTVKGADRTCSGFFRIGRAHDLAIFHDGVFSFQHRHKDRARRHVNAQAREKRPFFVHGVKRLRSFRRQSKQLAGNDS